MQQFVILALLSVGLSLPQEPSLDSPSPKERMAAVEAAGVLGNREAIPALARAVKDEPRSNIRELIVAALGRIRDREAIPALSEVLETDFDKSVRLQAINSLLRLFIPGTEEDPRTIFNLVKSVFVEKKPVVVPPYERVDASATEALARSLDRDFDVEVRAQAARALGSLGADDQLVALIEALESPRNEEYPEVRIEIVQSLGLIRNPEAGLALVRALGDDKLQIVQKAAFAIGLVGYKEAFPTLAKLFRTHRDRGIRHRSLEAISLMRAPKAVSLFESLLDHSDDYYREMAAEGLARLDYDAGGLEERLVSEDRDNVRLALAFALVSSARREHLGAIIDALDSRQDYQAEVYLYELSKYDGLLRDLYGYLESPNPKVRTKLLKVIGDVADPTSRPHIEPLTRDDNLDVAREAVAALRKLNRAQ